MKLPCILIFALFAAVGIPVALAKGASGPSPWLSFAANLEGGFRSTQFFEDSHDATVGSWDARIELWLPPHREVFSFGLYLRHAGIAANRDPAWENAILAGPGAGVQVYPFSYDFLRNPNRTFLDFLGPVRLFAEKNDQHYRGSENSWRPRQQERVGGEYWLSLHANDTASPWWAEVWAGYWRQSANEFDARYDTWISAQSVRFGLRVPKRAGWSSLTPYLLAESSRTRNHAYYWENAFRTGAGLRFAPPLRRDRWPTRFVIFAEYVRVESYYRSRAPDETPRHDWHAGVNLSLGEWYHQP